MNMKITVKKRPEDVPALCKLVLSGGRLVYKCGACGCGNIEPVVGFKCGVCLARVNMAHREMPTNPYT